MLIMCVTTNVNIPCNHITMSYHALMQTRVLLLDATGLPDAQYNYYKDFSGCLLIDNGRVTLRFKTLLRKFSCVA